MDIKAVKADPPRRDAPAPRIENEKTPKEEAREADAKQVEERESDRKQIAEA